MHIITTETGDGESRVEGGKGVMQLSNMQLYALTSKIMLVHSYSVLCIHVLIRRLMPPVLHAANNSISCFILMGANFLKKSKK